MNNVVKIKESDWKTFVGRAKNFYNIRTEENEIRPYEPHEAQQKLNKIKDEEFERTNKLFGAEQCKIILLKSRQVGGTTDTACHNYDIMQTLDNARGLVLAHDERTTPIIYQKYKILYENTPDYAQIVNDDGSVKLINGEPLFVKIKHKHEHKSGFRLSFEDGKKSDMIVRTAGSGDNVGKGDTINFCHFSEAANYDHFNDVINSVNQQMGAKGAFVYSVIESTANGVSGKGKGFYDFWMKSVSSWEAYKNGRSDYFTGYRPVFISWYELKKYRMPLINGKMIGIDDIDFHTPETKKDFLEMEEQIVEEVFKNNREEGLEAINWYRYNTKENCSFDINQAKRYYPTTPEDAFLSTDTCYFNTAKLFQVNKKYKEKEPEKRVGYINDDLEFEESNFGDLAIWEEPEDKYRNRYICSCDPSYGIEDGDYSCIFVFDRLEQKFVAKWYGNVKEDILAQELLKIAMYYNDALIIPESNLRTVTTLISPDGMIPYTGDLYYQEVKSRRGDLSYGFNTNGESRQELLAMYNRWLREDYFRIPDSSSLEEHVAFTKKVTGNSKRPKYEATEGMHDDQVISMALCIEGDRWWDEEIYQTDQEETDIVQIYNKPRKSKRFIKLSNIN